MRGFIEVFKWSNPGNLLMSTSRLPRLLVTLDSDEKLRLLDDTLTSGVFNWVARETFFLPMFLVLKGYDIVKSSIGLISSSKPYSSSSA